MAEFSPDLRLKARNQQALVPGEPAADAILRLLAHMACSDGVIHDDEFRFMQRVLPNRDEASLRQWVAAVGEHGPQLSEVAQALTTIDARWTCLRYVARMAWKDGELQSEERSFLDQLAETLRLPRGAVERVLTEMRPSQTVFTEQRLVEVIKQVKWDAVQVASGDVVSADLAMVAPSDLSPVCRIGLERVEVMAFYATGLTARFREGTSFLPWSELVSYTRGTGLGDSVTLLTEGGMSLRLVDSRLTGLCLVLDHLLAGSESRPKGAAPVVEHVRGE